MFWRQADIYLPIRLADGAAASAHVVGPAGESDVVHNQRPLFGGDNLSDGGFNPGKTLPCRLQTGTRRHSDVQANLPGVYIRKEVLSDAGRQNSGPGEK